MTGMSGRVTFEGKAIQAPDTLFQKRSVGRVGGASRRIETKVLAN